jgi:hypothetical protein
MIGRYDKLAYVIEPHGQKWHAYNRDYNNQEIVCEFVGQAVEWCQNQVTLKITYGLEERPGSQCLDGGKCHHNCTGDIGCFRKQTCEPLTGSGLNNNWEPIETA